VNDKIKFYFINILFLYVKSDGSGGER
jgi:hypothetical protein